jgi:diguanylate cyclase (GGDEF)-like protein
MRQRTAPADANMSSGPVPRVAVRIHWHLVGVLALGVASSGSVWGLFKQRERQIMQAEFAARAKERVVAVGREVRDDVDLLYAVSAYFAGSEEVDQQEFLAFVGSLTTRARSVQAIEWAPRVTNHERQSFERRLLDDSPTAAGIVERGDGDRLKAAEVRDVYFPVQFAAEPSGSRAGVPGFDHSSEPARWRAMQKAVESGDAVATERLELFRQAQHESDRDGILVAMPVFAREADAPLARRESLTGFIVGVYRLSDIVSRALADFTDMEVNCRILDVTHRTRRQYLHLHLARNSGAGGVDYHRDKLSSDLVYAAPIDVPGRNWVVECWPTQQFVSAHASILPIASLVTGLVLTGMIALLIWMVDGRADAVERTVVERTAALQKANEELEAEVHERLIAERKLAEHARNLEESNRQLEQARSALQRQATIDPLTGVMNRHSLGERSAAEWSRTCRQKLPLSCIMLDVDFFKKINDTHGHLVGDEVLQTLAQLLREHTRDYDCVARFGGEEFCVLLPSTHEGDAIEWAERLRKVIAAHSLHDGADTFHTTVSIGVASRTADVKGPEELLNQADEAMLVAKRQGRNRVIAFSGLHRLATDLLDSGGSVFRGACAADIMTPVLVHLTPTQSLEEAARLLLSLRLDSVPVIDDDGRTLGIIGEEDLTAQILSDKGWRQVVGEAMNTTPVTYDAKTPAADICEFLSRVTVRRVIILQQGRPVGLISRSTLIRWLKNALRFCSDEVSLPQVDAASPDVVTERLRSTIDRLTGQIVALQQGVESSQGVVTPVVVSAATRIQELVDDALLLSADQDADSVGGYATMGAVLS